MKKFLISIFIILNTLNIVSATSSYNGYSDIKEYDFNFRLENTGAKIVLYWDKFEKGNLKYYKVVKSTNNSSPSYPEDGYIKYSTDISFTEYADYSKLEKTTYYRICAITNENYRYCSKVLTATPVEKNYETKTVTTTTNTYNLSNSVKIKADILIDTFISKMKEKNYENTQIIIKIDNTINNLKKLKEQKPNLKYIVNYLIEKLESRKLDYEDEFQDIEAIFDL